MGGLLPRNWKWSKISNHAFNTRVGKLKLKNLSTYPFWEILLAKKKSSITCHNILHFKWPESYLSTWQVGSIELFWTLNMHVYVSTCTWSNLQSLNSVVTRLLQTYMYLSNNCKRCILFICLRASNGYSEHIWWWSWWPVGQNTQATKTSFSLIIYVQ